MEAISYFSDCFGRRRKFDDDRQPLLPQYADDTTLQRQLHQKLHTYQEIRALGKGFMPDTEQTIINLRTLLASDVLNEENPDLSESGRQLVKYTRRWIQQFSELLRNKNDKDQIQDLIWFLSKSRISIDTNDLAAKTKKSKAKADTLAAFESMKTVGSLMLMNEDFRTFLGDLNVVGREVFRDSAFKLSEVANEAGKGLDPSEQNKQLVAQPGEDKAIGAPTNEQLGNEVADASKAVVNGTAQVAKTAIGSAEKKLSGSEGKTLFNRLKQTILSLRQKPDYEKSVSTLSLLIQRYAMLYSRVAEDTMDAAAKDTHQNAELDRAVHNAWLFLTSFGNEEDWKKVEQLWQKALEHKDKDPEFETMMMDVGNSVQKLLTDPEFLDNAPAKINELKERSKEVGKDSSLHADVQALLQQLDITLRGVVQDEDVNKLITTTMSLFHVLSPLNHRNTNPELLQDSINVFVPLLINAIQYLPIPRIEVSTPSIDLLMENLIIEPGTTVNQTSFLPYRMKVETYNDIDIYRTHTLRTAAKSTNLVTIKLDGLSMRADEVGFWMRLHSGMFSMQDEGIASFALDERGVDIHIDVEIAKERLEQILTLKAVRVHIHKLTYNFRKSKFSWLGFLLKPILRPILRKTMEKQLANGLADFFHAANRELLFARERLRATRISQPDDIMTFVKAVAARLTPPDDPDVYTRVGIAQPGKGVFKGKYAPGSIVKVWNEEGARASERVDDFDAGGWRNEIFDTHVQVMT